MPKTLRRVLFWTAAGFVLVLGVAVYLVERNGTVPAPRSLLADRPAFPSAWPRYARDRAATVGWRNFGTRSSELRVCGAFGGGALRAWQYTLGDHGDPVGIQTVCTYKSELLARAVYVWQSLPGVAGEADWPNFEGGSETRPTPRNAANLKSDADEWEIGCGLGDPEGACQVWIFRGRYGRAMMAAEFQFGVGSPGRGSRFEDVRVFFESLNADLTRRLRGS